MSSLLPYACISSSTSVCLSCSGIIVRPTIFISRNKETLEIIEVFENGADVERKYPQYLAKTINRACTGNLKTAYGFIWKRLNKE